MDNLLTMSKREVTRLEAMQRIKDKRLTQKEAAGMLSLSVWQIKRLHRAYKARGAKGLISTRRGKPSNHRMDPHVEQRVLDLLKEKYETLQDRLVKELRLLGISDIDSANAYLPEFRQDFNRRFTVAPRSNHDAHRPLLKTDNLDLILTHQKTATLSKNLTVQSNKVIYQVQSNRPDYALRNTQVTICENAKGEVTILYKNKPLAYTIYHKPTRQAEVADTKTLDRQIKLSKSPAPNHPWRQYGRHLNGKTIQEALPNGSD